MKSLLFACIATGLFAGSVFSATAGPASPLPAVARKSYSPGAVDELRSLIGRKVVIVGKVVAAGANKSGKIRYLNFTKNYKDSLALVFFTNMGGGMFTKEKLADYVNRTVRANGVVSDYKGALQMKIESLDQIRTVPGQ